jgi:hypothetical protein
MAPAQEKSWVGAYSAFVAQNPNRNLGLGFDGLAEYRD